MMESAMEELIGELKVKIVTTLNLISVAPDSIDIDAQLVGGDLGLDSIDVLELVMMIEKDYGVRIDNKELGIRVFASLKALAEYIHQNRPETSP
jgi:acyl carrier protein